MISNPEVPLATHVHTGRILVDDTALRQRILAAIPNVEDLTTESFDIHKWSLDARDAGSCLRSFELVPGAEICVLQLQLLLDRAPLLETLKIAKVTAPRRDLRAVVHSHVSTFVLHSHDDMIFRSVVFPALRSLTYISKSRNDYSWPWWRTFSQCRLTELSILHSATDSPSFIDLLSNQTQLVTLELNKSSGPTESDSTPVSSALLEFLSIKPKGDRRLPALQILRIVVIPRHLKAVRRLVRSRCGERARNVGIAELVEVEIHTSTTRKESDPNRRAKHTSLFTPFVDAGLQVRISYGALGPVEHFQRRQW